MFWSEDVTAGGNSLDAPELDIEAADHPCQPEGAVGPGAGEGEDAMPPEEQGGQTEDHQADQQDIEQGVKEEGSEKEHGVTDA